MGKKLIKATMLTVSKVLFRDEIETNKVTAPLKSKSPNTIHSVTVTPPLRLMSNFTDYSPTADIFIGVFGILLGSCTILGKYLKYV